MPTPSLRSLAARRAVMHQHAIDPAAHIQRFARDRGRFRRITRYRRTYELVYMLWIVAFETGPSSWRDATRDLLRMTIESAGSFAAIDRASMRVLRTASRIRFTMQRFVRSLQRIVLRARRMRPRYEMARDIAIRVSLDVYPDTWRDAANDRMYDHTEDLGGLMHMNAETIRSYMFVHRMRYVMQRFVRELRARVAARRRRVRQRLN